MSAAAGVLADAVSDWNEHVDFVQGLLLRTYALPDTQAELELLARRSW